MNQKGNLGQVIHHCYLQLLAIKRYKSLEEILSIHPPSLRVVGKMGCEIARKAFRKFRLIFK